MTIVYPVRRDKTFVIPEAMFRTKSRPTHGGLDLTPVVQGAAEECFAVEAGRIIISGFSSSAGNNIMILADSGRRWWYGHLSSRAVKVGARVSAGQFIGRIGNTGNSFGAHLHLELHYPSINVENDPWKLIWDAPDVTGSKMPPAPSRAKALSDYPKYKPTNPTTPVSPPEQSEEEYFMSIESSLKAWFQATLNSSEARIKNELRAEFAKETSRRRADTRGFIFLDCGEPFNNDLTQAKHAVLIGMNGEIRVLEPPVKVGMGQIESHIKGESSRGTDYRWVDPNRWASPLTTGKFWNRIKDTLTGLNYFGDDRQVTVAEAKAWVAKHEALKAKK